MSKILSRDEIQAAPQHAQIVVGAMQHNLSGFERFAQRLQIETGQRIDDEIVATAPKAFGVDRGRARLQRCTTGGRHADLKQAKFFVVRMQTVGFCIERDAIGGVNPLQHLSQLGIGRNETRS